MSPKKTICDLSVTVHRLSRLISNHVQRQMEMEGIDDMHPSSGAILLPLLDEEGQTLTDLSRHLHMKAPTITVIANRLENKGLIRRERGKVDRRQVHLYLTKGGREKAEALDAIRRKAVLQMGSGLDMKDLAHANETLLKIIDNSTRKTDG